MPGTDRRSSTSSDDASIPPIKQILPDGTEFIPTRTAKTAAPKPAANPLQFIKVGPCDLYKAAQEQLKKVEEIKKVEKAVKEDSEDWQSNLDNWKCSRRKRQEHIIDRVVEVKKLELEEHERNRRRGKTLNEMMEERTQKGVGPRKTSLLVYPDDDSSDLTDLGISVTEKSNGDDDNSFQPNQDDKVQDVQSNGMSIKKKNGVEMSSEPEEYTYERAIEGYKSFAEKTAKAASRPRVSPPKPGGRIGEKLNELEQVRMRSNSVSDVQLPKVDIHKRRSLFEVVESAETKSPSAERVAKDLGGAKIVKERLSSLERRSEIPVKANRVAEEVTVSLKDRLSILEKQKTTESIHRAANDEVSHISIKERLSSLKESVNSNSCSDEDRSPAASDREVSSPVVSSNTISNNVGSSGTNHDLVEGVGSVAVSDEKGNKVDANFLFNEIPQLDKVGTQEVLAMKVVAEDHSHMNQMRGEEEEKEEKIKMAEGQHLNNETSLESTETIEGSISKENVGKEEVAKEIKVQQNICASHSEENFVINVKNNLMTNEEVLTGVLKQQNGSVSKVLPAVENSCAVSVKGDTQLMTIAFEETSNEPSKHDAHSSNVKSTTVESSLIVSDERGAAIHSIETIAMNQQPPPFKIKQIQRKVVKKPVLRRRKLTPILTAPLVILSPAKPPSDLQIISEDAPTTSSHHTLLDIIEDETLAEHVENSPVPAPRKTAKGAGTSESGIDMEESSLYTDENIDEVLGEDDVDEDYHAENNEHYIPNSARDLQLSKRQRDPHLVGSLREELLCKRVPEHHVTESVDEMQLNDRKGKHFIPDPAPEQCDRPIEHMVADSVRDLQLCNRQIKLTGNGNDSSFSKVEKYSDEAISIANETTECESQKCDLQELERRQQEAVTRFDELIGISVNEAKDVENRKGEPDKVESSKSEPEKVEKPLITSYDNMITTNQLLDLSNTSEVITFPLSPVKCVEPPTEKPPPPPVDMSDEEEHASPSPSSLRRLDSTKRIKKEIRKKRSHFLGIEGGNDDAYLDPEVDVEPPPDMMTLLQEERRLEQQLYRQSLSSEADSADLFREPARPGSAEQQHGLYRQSICSESDSNHETAESRDSGVELDRGHDLVHSRQNSEPYGNPSVTSEEDEISKKEREIIEVLEKEEEWRYGKTLSEAQDQAVGESLAAKLRQLEEEKLQLEWERAEEEGRRMADQERLQAKEALLRQQETSPLAAPDEENLRAERERLEREHVELARVRQELLARQPLPLPPQQPSHHMASNLRYSMPNLQDVRAPPRIASAENLLTSTPMNRHSTENLIVSPPMSRHSVENLLAPQQMSRTTRQALSAAPRCRIVNGEAWMQPKRKTDASKSSYNYQHWLIQEAEHRRITEQQQRVNQSRRSLPTQQRTPTQSSPSKQARPHPLSPSSHAHSHTHPITPHPPISHHTVGLPPTPPAPHNHLSNKPLPDAVIQTLTQRVQNKATPRRRIEERSPAAKLPSPESPLANGEQERMLSVSGKKKCSHCGEELGRGAAMVIESLRLFYHIACFKCCVCHTQLGDGLMGTDVRVRNNKLHCHNCYSSDDVPDCKINMQEEVNNIPLADDDPQVVIEDEPVLMTRPRSIDSFTNGSSSPGTHCLDADISPDEQEEKARLISQLLELQNTLDDLSQRVDSVKEENLKLKSENQVLGQYIENLMSASSVFQSTSPKSKKK